MVNRMHILAGKYFIEKNEDGEMTRTGRLDACIEPGYWLASLMNFIDGDLDCQVVIALCDMTDGFKLYDDEKDWVRRVNDLMGK